MDKRDKAAQAAFLAALPSVRAIAEQVIDMGELPLMLSEGERIIRRQPVTQGTVVEYDPRGERIVYGNRTVYVIALATKKRWWQR